LSNGHSGLRQLFDSSTSHRKRQFAQGKSVLVTSYQHYVPELDKYFTEVRSIVDEELDRIVPSTDVAPERLYNAIRWSLFGEGKRFRPALVFAAGREFGAADARLVSTAAAVEMIHTYSLIHDDLPAMDDDDMRRGRATVHKKFDEATAILAGDALQAMAFETIANDDTLSDSLRLKLVSELAVAAGRMVAGQQLDLEAEGKSLDLTSIENIHKGKTGALISFSIRAGGLIAGVGDQEMEALTDFGEQIGLLFQITDDILDVTSTSEKLGKTAGKDEASEKATYPDVLGLEGALALAQRVETIAVDVLGRMPREFSLLEAICRYTSRRHR
jgi:geranylgeranyl pyrophosphate synthase